MARMLVKTATRWANLATAFEHCCNFCFVCVRYVPYYRGGNCWFESQDANDSTRISFSSSEASEKKKKKR